jgi:hypothetical protein
MIVTLCVALIVTSLGVWNTSARTARQLVDAQAALSSAEAMAAARAEQIEAEFFGHFPPPILAIDPKLDKAQPALFAIFNSKNFSQSQTRTTGPLRRTDDPKRIRFDLRLLRSLDKKDYYRLKWGVDDAIDQPKEQGLTTVLFEYDGKSLTLVDNEAVSIVLAPKRIIAIESILALRPADEAAALREKWLSTPVHWNSIPAVRPIPSIDDFE